MIATAPGSVHRSAGPNSSWAALRQAAVQLLPLANILTATFSISPPDEGFVNFNTKDNEFLCAN